MRIIFAILVLVAVAGGGYYFYSQSRGVPVTFSSFQVLGATTSSLWQSGLNLLNGATDGAAEPVINQAVSDLQSRVKDLPREQYERVKYEFCKDLVMESN